MSPDPLPGSAARPPEPAAADGLGSRAHVRATLARAGAAVEQSKAEGARSVGLLLAAAATVDAAERRRRESAALRAELRESVAAYARRLHGEGVRPERMLVLVKEAVREATPAELPPADARLLLDDLVSWSIRAYYAAA